MTREEAIYELNDLRDYCKHTFMKNTLLPYLESLDMAIKALEQEPCENCISRQAALDAAKDLIVPLNDGTIYTHRCIDPQCIRELPPAQPVNKNRK